MLLELQWRGYVVHVLQPDSLLRFIPVYAKLHANLIQLFSSQSAQNSIKVGITITKHANDSKHEACHTCRTIIAILWHKQEIKTGTHAVYCKAGCSVVTFIQREKTFSIISSPGSGVNNPHLSEVVNVTPAAADPVVPEEYLEHCFSEHLHSIFPTRPVYAAPRCAAARW